MAKNQMETRKRTTKKDEFDFLNFLRHYWLGVKRFWAISLAFSALVAGAVFAYSKLTYVPMYKSSVTFLATPLVKSSNADGTAIYQYSNREGLGSQLSTSFPSIFTSGVLREIVTNELGHEIGCSISAVSSPATNYFQITVEGTDPSETKNVADSLLRNYPRVAENVLGDIKAEVKIPSKMPTEPYNTLDYVKWVLLSFGGSIALCLVLICVYVLRRKTVCSKNDIRYVLNQNHLCEIPLVKGKGKKEHERFKTVIRSKGFIESMRTIKNRTLGIIEENGYKIIGCVSTSEHEGRTSIATGYAKTLAGNDEKSILVVFRSGSSENKKSSSGKKGKHSTVDILDAMAYEKPNGVLPGIKRLFSNVDLLVLSQDTILDKVKTQEILDTLKSEYNYVIVDIVPGESHSEAVTLANFCDAYMSVIRCDYLSSQKVKATLNYLSYSTAENLGAVLNEVSSAYISYGRYNGYGKYSKYGYNYDYQNYGYGRYGANPDITKNPSEK